MPMSDDPIVPKLEAETARRRRRMFAHARVPVRMMVPNMFTLFGLCAGLTSIRMSIEGRWDWALAAIVLAALLDGVDGRIARLLKASSRFGAELDSLADFVNFGVAPAVLLFTWGFSEVKSIGWIAVLIFALASALRLARFNVALDEDKPRWQSNYFQGVPTPAAAIVVLVPLYLYNLGVDLRSEAWERNLLLVYTVGIAMMMVSNIPTYSGKLLHERIGREWVLPLMVAAMAAVLHLITYPYATLLAASLGYLAFVPVSWRRFGKLEHADAAAAVAAGRGNPATKPGEQAAGPNVVGLRPPGDKR
jgi:CDP-diacylglycerol--serine O-phosphatidyltransferase